MKPLVQIIVLAIALSGCNNLNDLRPEDPAKVIPEMVVNVVKDKFPKGEDLVFKPVLEDRVWEVKLKSDADRYSSLVDHGKMWETFKVSPDGPPSVLQESLKKTVFGDGTLSAYSTEFFATTAKNKLLYQFKGETYSFEWSGVNQNVNGWASFDQSLYRITTYEISDLPAYVKDSIQAKSNMSFLVGYTWVQLDDSKLYFVIANKKNGDRIDRVSMLFDDKGKLRWSSTGFNQPGAPNVSSNMETVPEAIRQFVDSRPELAGCTYDLKLMNTVDGLTSYYFILRIGNERCDLYFDKDFNVLSKRYSVILY